MLTFLTAIGLMIFWAIAILGIVFFVKVLGWFFGFIIIAGCVAFFFAMAVWFIKWLLA